jgi:hypothetical protein
MQVYEELHDEAPPPCTLLAIRGERFELGEAVSPEATAHLNAALKWTLGWLDEAIAAAHNSADSICG